MTYSQSDFGRELLAQLDSEWDYRSLSKWAWNVFSGHRQEIGEDATGAFKRRIQEIIFMGDDPQFEMSEEELRNLAAQMIEHD